MALLSALDELAVRNFGLGENSGYYYTGAASRASSSTEAAW